MTTHVACGCAHTYRGTVFPLRDYLIFRLVKRREALVWKSWVCEESLLRMIMNHYKCGCWRDQASLQIWGDHLSVSLGCWGFLPRGDSQGFLKLTVSIVILNCGSLVCTLHQTPFGCTLVPAVLWNWNTRALLSHRLGCKRSCLYLYIYIYIHIHAKNWGIFTWLLKVTEWWKLPISQDQCQDMCIYTHRCAYMHTYTHTSHTHIRT